MAEKILIQKDPGCIVIDEIAGIMIALLGMPFNTISVAAGFITFRIIDILKPFPIRYMERRLTGGVGVVTDDLMAGVYSNIILRLLFMTTGTS